MASPQIENGHIDIANTIADKFCLYRLSGQEWQIVWVILRKTWGWLVDIKNKNGPKKKMDRIALSQFEQLTGIDRRKCHSILKKLVAKKVVKKIVTQKSDRFVITYGFQKNFDLWKVSPKKVTVTQKGNKTITQKGAHKRYIKDKELYSRVVTYLNKKTKKHYKPGSKTTKKLIDARIKEKFLPEDFKTVIDNKTRQWINDPDNNRYLRPQTLFGNKFESYLNETKITQFDENQKDETPEDIELEIKKALS